MPRHYLALRLLLAHRRYQRAKLSAHATDAQRAEMIDAQTDLEHVERMVEEVRRGELRCSMPGAPPGSSSSPMDTSGRAGR